MRPLLGAAPARGERQAARVDLGVAADRLRPSGRVPRPELADEGTVLRRPRALGGQHGRGVEHRDAVRRSRHRLGRRPRRGTPRREGRGLLGRDHAGPGAARLPGRPGGHQDLGRPSDPDASRLRHPHDVQLEADGAGLQGDDRQPGRVLLRPAADHEADPDRGRLRRLRDRRDERCAAPGERVGRAAADHDGRSGHRACPSQPDPGRQRHGVRPLGGQHGLHVGRRVAVRRAEGRRPHRPRHRPGLAPGVPLLGRDLGEGPDRAPDDPPGPHTGQHRSDGGHDRLREGHPAVDQADDPGVPRDPRSQEVITCRK
jgi:hypothetical protein